MAKFNALLNLRLKSKESKNPKMTALAEQTSKGDLSSFSGVFRVSPLNDREKASLETLLKNFRQNENYDVDQDLNSLVKLTSEVKAITNQAVILHGERIKKAQEILKIYKDGAFTAWLITTYGNRQTPYNFLQYYEFYVKMPNSLHQKIDSMPRQAVYTLASRTGEIEKKQDIINNYNGQPKQELLTIIRRTFPLAETDKRNSNGAIQVVHLLNRIKTLAQNPNFSPSAEQEKQIKKDLQTLSEWMS